MEGARVSFWCGLERAHISQNFRRSCLNIYESVARSSKKYFRGLRRGEVVRVEDDPAETMKTQVGRKVVSWSFLELPKHHVELYRNRQHVLYTSKKNN